MNYKKVLILIALVFAFQACQEGAASLPELSVSIFKALKGNDFNALIKTGPSVKSREKYLELYEFNAFRDPGERKQEAMGRYKKDNVQLKKEYDKTINDLNAAGIDWKKSTLKDYKYEINDTKEGYHQALIKLIIANGDKLFKVNCNGVQVGDRWFLVKGMEVQG